MHLGESLRIGFKGLLSHKLRSFLTMLGVVFGVAAVIAMVSIGEGAKSEAVEQIKLLGANNIRVKPVELHGKNLEEARRKNVRGIQMEDAHAIADISPHVEAVAGLTELEQKVRAGAKNPEANVIGIEPVYVKVSDARVRDGRFIDEERCSARRKGMRARRRAQTRDILVRRSARQDDQGRRHLVHGDRRNGTAR